jgi:hypothetical protein
VSDELALGISISPEKGQNVFMMFKFNVLMMGLQGA